jgi:hypothetical protein
LGSSNCCLFYSKFLNKKILIQIHVKSWKKSQNFTQNHIQYCIYSFCTFFNFQPFWFRSDRGIRTDDTDSKNSKSSSRHERKRSRDRRSRSSDRDRERFFESKY